ncbi:tetraacyldisaccharide 4'-kinase [Thiospirillum jenense]|uniref:Tetraacyldisaccharide 4'-kinase n=1 Tax=Thiospirillum jenense TaxID=1653858 RepID=A0A839HEY3_9GAMM|nr:tetraacyldisaccharide 4'-kinase [Thiospirillum jenense]MBB1127034.1 tetraacyldisaccharide 4'-kinase [Thiospirillum jenense]
MPLAIRPHSRQLIPLFICRPLSPFPLNPNIIWYSHSHPLAVLFAPLSGLYCGFIQLRARAYQFNWLPQYTLNVPVIIVGNLTVGGTGKTPLVLWLADHLRGHGWRPGIVTRGYGGRLPRRQIVDVPIGGDPAAFGDEPLLLAANAGCPVVAGRDRVAAARRLIDAHGCDVVIADDGLQHLRLGRAIEIAVIDGQRGFGNGRCLPAGPLREPYSRLNSVDFILCNGDDAAVLFQSIAPQCKSSLPHWSHFYLQPQAAVNLVNLHLTRSLADLQREFGHQIIRAVAGIGHPERFFSLLEQRGFSIHRCAYPDHHVFTAEEVRNWSDAPVLMTEKDAVKCRPFALPQHWYLPVIAEPAASFIDALQQRLNQLRPQ